VLYVLALADKGLISHAVLVDADDVFVSKHCVAFTAALVAHAPFMLDAKAPPPRDVPNKAHADNRTLAFNLEFSHALAAAFPGCVPEHSKIESSAARTVNVYKSGVDATTKASRKTVAVTSKAYAPSMLIEARLRVAAASAAQLYRILTLDGGDGSPTRRTYVSAEQLARAVSRVGSERDVLFDMLTGLDMDEVANVFSLTVVPPMRSVVEASEAEKADPEYRPNSQEWERAAKAALQAALSTTSRIIEPFREGILRGVRTHELSGSWLVHKPVPVDPENLGKQRDCVLCCKNCERGDGGKARQGAHTVKQCSCCGVALCVKSRVLWAGKSCWDVFHTTRQLPKHPFALPPSGAAASPAVLRRDTQTNSAKRRRRRSDGSQDFSGKPRGRVGDVRGIDFEQEM
jgi:hypothetical protein